MESHKNLTHLKAYAFIIGLVGMVIIGGVAGRQIKFYGFDFEVIGISLGGSLLAVSIITFVQLWLLGDPNGSIEKLLKQVLVRKLPIGVARLFLTLADAPSFDQMLHGAKKVTFFGPGGAFILDSVAIEAFQRNDKNSLILEMFLPKNQKKLQSTFPD